MIRNYFKIAWRNIIHHKVYSIINIAGLAVGIAACLLIFVELQYELSFNTSQPNYKNIYHVVTRINHPDGITYSPGAADPVSEALRLDFPQAKVGALETNYGGQITVPSTDGNAQNDKKFIVHTGFVFIEPQFFDVFKWNWLAGRPAVLNEPNMVVLDKSTAIKYFGNWNNALGKTVVMDNLLTLKVAGIVDDAPTNTDLPLKVMVSYPTWKEKPDSYAFVTNWYSTNPYHHVFMSFPANTGVENINNQLGGFSKRHFDARAGQTYTLFAQPLADMHFDTRFDNILGDHFTPKSNLRTLGYIGLLIIIMAAINFINLSTAQSVNRSKEIGIRKVMGSTRLQLIIQVMGETTIIVISSVILAFVIAEIGLPYLKGMTTLPYSVSLVNAGIFWFLAGTTIAVILLSGLYPALIVSGFKPVLAIKNKITAATIGGVSLRRTLVVSQFVISQLLIIGTIVTVGQMNYVNNADLGFDKSAVCIIYGPVDSTGLHKMKVFKQQLLQDPQVRSASFVTDAPSSSLEWASNFFFNNSETAVDFQAFLKEGDADYFKTFGLHFVAGKGYENGDSTRQAVVNQTMARRLGFQNPQDIIGKSIKAGNKYWSVITGVVKDFKSKSLREGVQPMVIFPRDGYGLEMAVKVHTAHIRSTMASIQKIWGGIYPQYAYNYYFVDADIIQFYRQDNQMVLIYKLFAGIAIFISCLGLYGLISFMAVQRTKEIGIRKVLGASVSSIVYLFSKEFTILILISFAIAVPAGWYFMNSWLQSYVYRINLSVWIFGLAIVVSVTIAWLTVGYKAVKAALVNPVKSLRSE
jgi:putative ABC transport system permease protein